MVSIQYKPNDIETLHTKAEKCGSLEISTYSIYIYVTSFLVTTLQ